ncbi:MAG: sigma-54-dependent transcriptional regulator [Candidatus Methylomirabilales bacterium]
MMGDRRKRILIIDDEPDMAENIGLILSRAGYSCTMCTEGPKAVVLVAEEQPDLIVTDLRMPELDGMALLDRAKEEGWEVPVIMVTGYATIEAAVEAMKKGASDFLAKPFPPEELVLKVGRALDLSRVLEENRYLRRRLEGDPRFKDIVGKSGPMQQVFAALDKVMATDSRVLITGESGTGKEVVARAIHAGSPRHDRDFFAVNCVALTESLLESELFGHEKGAFTGAISTKKGVFELADGGTLFLDEIGDTSPAFQAKLLRVVQESEFKRVGGVRRIRTDVRIISSTNQEIKKAIAGGTFREDLYYRLSVVHIHLPPLRERKEDIPLLVDHFLAKIQARIARKVTGVSAEALDLLQRYHWRGNVRELENVIERALIMAPGEEITPAELPLPVDLGQRRRGGGSLEELERELIERTLVECDWNKTEAARRMGIGRRTLYEKAARLGISLRPD